MWRALQSWFAERVREGRQGGPDDAERQPIETIVKDDGRERLAIYRRSDNRYEYALERFYVIDVPEYRGSREYWAPLTGSGLFDSIESTKREAATVISWIDPSRRG
jgi:hypothetical protein